MASPAPLLRWAGSKKRQFGKMEPFFPRSLGKYIEPFAGSAAFAFRLAPSAVVVNDVNRDVIDFYRHASTKIDKFYDAFSKLPRGKRSYYRIRANFNASHRGFERSVLFYYLNRNCFNGIYRVNLSGEFNVPFSGSRVAPYPSKGSFAEAARKINDFALTCHDFEKCCESHAHKGDFVYMDPPYVDDSRRIFSEYNQQGFGLSDFHRLAKLLVRLNGRGVKFLVSYPKTKEALQLANDWASDEIVVRRSVAGNPAFRISEDELLIFNYDQNHT